MSGKADSNRFSGCNIGKVSRVANLVLMPHDQSGLVGLEIGDRVSFVSGCVGTSWQVAVGGGRIQGVNGKSAVMLTAFISSAARPSEVLAPFPSP